MADLKIVISALNNASGSIAKVKGDIKQLGDSGKTAEGGVKGLGAALGGAWTTALAATAAIAAVGAAIGKTYEIAKEGAALQYAEARFNNLAIAAGTTADVLLGDMREATKGMMSDAELVASGADLMALGLAKSHDEVVRLTTVAGALKMNMNQLVLTLTNQTTMRFDALGVSVDGFREKVKALEAAGLSANDAFKEAFLQQAEDQILKVGSAADSSIGAFQRMEASQANYFNALKQDLVEAGTWWANYWEQVYNDMTSVKAYNALIEHAQALGIDTKALDLAVRSANDYGRVTAAGIELNKAAVEALGEQVKYQTEMNVMRSRGTNANYEYSASEKIVTTEAIVMTEAQIAAAAAAEKYKESVTSTSAKFKFLTGSSGTYTDLLTQIKDKQDELSEMKPWQKASQSGKDLEAEIDTLIAKLGDLGEAMKLQSLQAAIEANGDVTEKEYKMMLDYMEQTGMITEQTAKKMMEDWRSLNNFQQSLRWDAEGNVIMIADEAYDTIDELKRKLKSIERKIGITVSVSQMGHLPTWVSEGEYATGGAVFAANGLSAKKQNPYVWQEYGYRGELFVPSQNGYILSRSDAARAVANTNAAPVYSGPSASDIANAVKQGVKEAMRDTGGGKIYNLTMPTSSNPADVRTAFELMEAWA